MAEIEVTAGEDKQVIQCQLSNAAGYEYISTLKGADFLCLEYRFNRIYLWYLAAPGAELQTRKFCKYGMGEPVLVGIYRGTAMMNSVAIHVFDEGVLQAGQPIAKEGV